MTRLLSAAVLAMSCLCSSVLCQTDTCYKKTDILFVIDASGSVGIDNFQKQLQFAATFVNRFVIGQAQFSLIRFESTADIIFGFNAYNDITALKNAILSIDYTGGGTDTAAALRLARQVAFSSSKGARPGVPKVVVVFTHGQSNSPNETATEAKNLKDSKVLVLSIGIGVGVNKVELKTIATYPGDVFVVIDYNQLLPIVSDYSELICSAVKLFKCNNQADVYFLLDTSTDIGPESFQKEREFVGNFSKNVDLETVYIGVGTFGGFATRRVFNLGQYKTQFLLEQGLSTALNLGGVSESNSALRFVIDQRLFEPTSGGRANASKILIILTDGHSVTASQAEKTALQLRSSGIDIIAVGVSKPNITELKSLVGHDVLDVVSNMLIPKVLSDRVETLRSVRECQLPLPQVPYILYLVSNICRLKLWENGIHPHPFNCSQFIECTFLKTDIMSCPTFEIYDPETKGCNYPGHVKEPCGVVIKNSPKPTARPVTTLTIATYYTTLCYDYSWADGIHPNPYDCSLYVECSASLTYLRNCLGGEAFDPTPAYRVCRDKSVAHTCSDPAYFGPTVVTAAPQVTASTRGPSAFDISDICQRYSLSDGIYPDPSNCNYFIECTNRGTQRLECPEGLHFNTANDVCDDVHAVNCQANYDFFFNFIPIIG